MSKQVIGVHYEGDEITKFKLDDNCIYSLQEAISMAKNGEIANVIVGKARSNRETLRSRNDGDLDNNFSNLPRF